MTVSFIILEKSRAELVKQVLFLGLHLSKTGDNTQSNSPVHHHFNHYAKVISVIVRSESSNTIESVSERVRHVESLDIRDRVLVVMFFKTLYYSMR